MNRQDGLNEGLLGAIKSAVEFSLLFLLFAPFFLLVRAWDALAGGDSR